MFEYLILFYSDDSCFFLESGFAGFINFCFAVNLDVSLKELIPGDDVLFTCTAEFDLLILIVDTANFHTNISYSYEDRTPPFKFNCPLFSGTSSRYEVIECVLKRKFKMSLSIRSVTVHDTGNYSCGFYWADGSFTPESFEYKQISVIGMFYMDFFNA